MADRVNVDPAQEDFRKFIYLVWKQLNLPDPGMLGTEPLRELASGSACHRRVIRGKQGYTLGSHDCYSPEPSVLANKNFSMYQTDRPTLWISCSPCRKGELSSSMPASLIASVTFEPVGCASPTRIS